MALKLHIVTEGDTSVGIWGDEVTLEINWEDTEENRSDLRENLGKTIAEFLDNGRANIWFDDECADCHNKKDKCKCPVM